MSGMGRESDWIGEGERESVEGGGDERSKRKREGRYLGREIQLILLFIFYPHCYNKFYFQDGTIVEL